MMKGAETPASRGFLILILLIILVFALAFFILGGYNLIKEIVFPG
jgi:hypothetical protein